MTEPFQDPLLILDRHRTENHSLRGMLAGASTFLVCGGPSANQHDLTKLKQRGVFSMAVNNMAGKVWTNSFVCADPPSKFHHGIWMDPTVMKFVPIPKMRGGRARLREKVGDEFKSLHRDDKECLVSNSPNVWAFSRRSWLSVDDTFFTDKDAAWGNHNSGTTRTGEPKTVCTMFLAIRLLSYLGARKIYLVGVDWRMDPSTDPHSNYAFGEERLPDAIKSNNDQYRIAGDWLTGLQNKGIFKKFGLEIFNCFSHSGLRAFPHVPFDIAIQETLAGFPSEPFDLQGWYKK